MAAAREYTVLIEEDEAGYLVAEVPALRACYTQARTLDELMERVREVILLCLEEQTDEVPPLRFVGVQRVTV
ncbi:MAG: type II toxin-antitoxin system HicB family antitoxin [Armatimonadetes bacterium]|nr:type II toxin-antitoxin system HicB family antitoxin [Armatimonadota bacterium]